MSNIVWTGGSFEFFVETNACSRILRELKLPTVTEFELTVDQLDQFDDRIRDLMDRIEVDRIGSEANRALAVELMLVLGSMRVAVYEASRAKGSLKWREAK